jgi:lysozyme family protein
MRENLKASLDIMLRFEGGWANDPRDPGGATMKGITKRTYEHFLGRPCTMTELRNISDAEVQIIYGREYWQRATCDTLPKGLDLCVFDAAVNSGVTRALKWLYPLKGSPIEMIVAFCDQRLAFMRRLTTWQYFGKGWARRVGSVKAEALKMAGRKDVITTEIKHHETSIAKNVTIGTSGVGTGTVITTTQPEHIAQAPLWVTLPITALIIGFVGFIFYKAWQDYHVSQGLKENSHG